MDKESKYTFLQRNIHMTSRSHGKMINIVSQHGSANQNHRERSLHTQWDEYNKKMGNNKCR